MYNFAANPQYPWFHPGILPTMGHVVNLQITGTVQLKSVLFIHCTDCFFFWCILRNQTAKSYDSLIFNFLEEPPYCFHTVCTDSRPTQQCNRVSFSIPLPTLVISCLCDNSASDKCEGILHCGFDLHFRWLVMLEMPFMYLLVNWMSLENSYSGPLLI